MLGYFKYIKIIVYYKLIKWLILFIINKIENTFNFNYNKTVIEKSNENTTKDKIITNDKEINEIQLKREGI